MIGASLLFRETTFTIDIAAPEFLHYAGLLATKLDPQRFDLEGVLSPEPLGVAAATTLAGRLAKGLDALSTASHI
jgi:hypothetical protein